MKDNTDPAPGYELVTEQAGQLLVSLGRLLVSLSGFCEDSPKTAAFW
jgi:hypothetical protein